MRVVMQILALIALILMIGHASALACSDITLSKGSTFEVEENDITILDVKVFNDTNQELTINTYDVIENESSIEAEVSDYDRKIPAHSTGTIRVRVESFEVSEETEAEFTLLVGASEPALQCELGKISEEFEVTVLDEDEFSASCSNIDLSTHTLHIETGKTNTEEFYIQNNSLQNFIVDSINITDSNYQVRIEELTFDREIDSGNSGIVKIDISGFYGNSFDGNATLDLLGHFTDQKSCQIIKKVPFTFINSSDVCNIQLIVDSVEELKANNKLEVRISNPSDESGNITLKAKNAVLSPSSIHVDAHSDKVYSITIQNASFTDHSEPITFTSDFDSCTVPVKTVTVFFGNELNSPINVQNIFAEYDLTEDTTITFTVENRSNDETTIELEVSKLPNDWVSERKIIQLEGNETREVSLRVLPGNEKEIVGIIRIEAGDYKTEKIVKLLGPGKTINVEIESVEKNADGSYTVTSTIENNSNTTVDGVIEIVVPSVVPIEDKKDISIPGHSKKTVTFQAHPTRPEVPASIIFKGEGKSGAAEIIFESPQKGSATAFNVFANSSLLGWVVVLAVLMVLGAYFYKAHQKGQEWSKK